MNARPNIDQRDAEARALLNHLHDCLVNVREREWRPVAELLAAWLDIAGAGSPELTSFGDIREDARWWADLATPQELEAYVGEGLRRIERTQFASVARKRLFVVLWETMGDSDRLKFLQRVDPDGKFRKAKS